MHILHIHPGKTPVDWKLAQNDKSQLKDENNQSTLYGHMKYNDKFVLCIINIRKK